MPDVNGNLIRAVRRGDSFVSSSCRGRYTGQLAERGVRFTHTMKTIILKDSERMC